MSLLSLRDVTVSYATPQGRLTALDALSLDVNPGERLAIIGESGSGKSTLAQAIAGILPPTASVSGTMLWQGRQERPRPGRDIGIVFQDPAASLDPVMRVGDQIAEVARAHVADSWPAARGNAAHLLEKVRLPAAVADAFPHQLSGGQKQRVALAAALAAKPTLLIADEATSALDTIVQAEIAALLDDLVRTQALTLIFISHDIALASQLVDRIAVFRDARLVELDTAETVLRQPRSAYTRSLIDAHLGIDG